MQKRIQRSALLNKLISCRENGSIKVISGLRRVGKSYLLFNLYYDYLIQTGVQEDHIIKIAFDDDTIDENLLDYKQLGSYIRSCIKDGEMYYVFLDEVQFVGHFEKTLNGLNRLENLDIYVTGSNSKFLSSDILTEFRGRGDEIRVQPLSFKEYLSVYGSDRQKAFVDYYVYGGLPHIIFCKTDEEKSAYLKNLYNGTYIRDVCERNNVRGEESLNILISILASSIGSLTNPTKLANTFVSVQKRTITDKTIRSYIDYIKNSFLINEVQRFDIKGKRYIGANSKFYFGDTGLRNVALNFRQVEPTHLIENVIYNELLLRGFNVDVGLVDFYEKRETEEKSTKKSVEIDFVCNKASSRYYIQSSFSLESREKTLQEIRPFLHTKDAFKKIIVTGEDIKPWYTEEGILVIGIYDFLLDESNLNL